MATTPYSVTNYMERFIAFKKNGQYFSRIMHNGECVYNFIDSICRKYPNVATEIADYPAIASIIADYPAIASIIADYPAIASIIVDYPPLVNSLVETGNKNYVYMKNNSYINIGYCPNNETIVKTKCVQLNTENTHEIPFGSRIKGTVYTQCFVFGYRNDTKRIRFDYGDNNQIFASVDLTKSNEILFSKNQISINGVNYGNFNSYSDQITQEITASIFAVHTIENKTDIYEGNFIGKIQYLYIYEGENLIMKLVPFIRNGNVGFLDIAPIINKTGNAVFYYNSTDQNYFSVVTE